MATHDYVIANGTGSAVRSDLNNALAAIVSNNSSSSEPSTRYAYQFWADTNANVLKIRNSANNGWITLRELDGTMLLEDGSASAPGLSFASDKNTGIFRPSDNELAISANGNERMSLSDSAVIINQDGDDVDFRVESNNNTHMLFVDGGNDRVAIGTSSADEILHVQSNVATRAKLESTGANEVVLAFLSNNASPGSNFINFGDSADSNVGQIKYDHSNNSLAITTDAAEACRFDSAQRLLLGTTASTSLGTDSYRAQIKTAGASAGLGIIRTADSVAPPFFSLAKSRDDGIVQSGDGLGKIQWIAHDGTDYNNISALINAEVDGTPGNNDVPGRLMFHTTADGASSPTEHMRISNTGMVSIHRQGATQQLRLGTIDGSTFTSNNENYMILYGNSANDYVLMRGCNTADGTPSLDVVVGNTRRIEIESDGDIFNVNGTYGTISDARLKENIVDASSQWDDVKDLQVRNFNFTEASGLPTNTQIGFVAQEVEQVSPGLVKTNPDLDQDGNDLGTTTKTVKTSVLLIKAVKALQEAMDRIETLEAKVAALEAG